MTTGNQGRVGMYPSSGTACFVAAPSLKRCLARSCFSGPATRFAPWSLRGRRRAPFLSSASAQGQRQAGEMSNPAAGSRGPRWADELCARRRQESIGEQSSVLGRATARGACWRPVALERPGPPQRGRDPLGRSVESESWRGRCCPDPKRRHRASLAARHDSVRHRPRRDAFVARGHGTASHVSTRQFDDTCLGHRRSSSPLTGADVGMSRAGRPAPGFGDLRPPRRGARRSERR